MANYSSKDEKNAWKKVKSSQQAVKDLGTFSSEGTNYINEAASTIANMPDFSSAGTDTINQGVQGLQAMGTFNPKNMAKYENAIKQYEDMGKFQYNLAGDPLFNQYKDSYTQMGKLAMEDTMGQAAALTGGYGNSYATSAGQQAYNSYMSELNNRIPELYNLALQNYNTEAARLQNLAGLYGDAVTQEANIYNTNSNYWNNLIGGGQAQFGADYDKYNAGLNKVQTLANVGGALVDADAATYNSALDYLTTVAGLDWDAATYVADTIYRDKRDKVTDKQWDKTYDLQERQTTLAEREFDWDISDQNPANQVSSTPTGFTYTNRTTNTEIDGNGNIKYTDANGKTVAVKAGKNPFTNGTNKRVLTDGEYDSSKAFGNGYQPNTAPNGLKLKAHKDKNGNKVTKTVSVIDSKGNEWGQNTQTVWEDTKGNLWIWDTTINEYVEL